MPDFDPLYSTSQIEAIERFILTHYSIATPISCSMLTRGMNDVYLIVGSDGARYVFRLSHHRARGPADVKTETEFLMHLSQSGVPVAASVPARSSSLFVHGYAPEGLREGVLFRAVNGREPRATDPRDASANGRTLALLHNAAATFSPEAALYRLDLEHLLHRPLERIRDSGLVKDAHIYSELATLAARTGRAIEGFSNLTWTVCHGDCHGFNSRINDAGEAVFFDFDDGGPGYLAYDLSVFLWAKVSFGRKLTDMWSAFIGGYRAIRPIAAEDIEASLWFVIVRHIWLMGEYASRRQEWGSETVGWIARETDFLKAWESEQLSNRLV